MANRRDQLQAYQFLMQRVVSALMVRETDPELTPLRRGVGAAFAGVMVSVLIAAGFGVYGVFTGIGGTSWKADGEIVVERDTGATFVYRHGALRPTLNYTSARLISGKPKAKVHRVATETLAGVPREAPVGIPGAPESLPAGELISRGPWTMCSVPADTSPGGTPLSSKLFVGQEIAGGHPLRQKAVLARDDTDGTLYLVWASQRFRIVGSQGFTPDQVVRAIFGPRAPIVPADTSFLNSLPAGQDIAPINVPERGSPSSVLSGHSVGDLIYHRIGDRRQYYLVLSDGLAPLTESRLNMLRGQYPGEPVEVSPAVANSAPMSQQWSTPARSAAPDRVPGLAGADTGKTLCSISANASSPRRVVVGARGGAATEGIPTSAQTPLGNKLADRIVVPPGQVVVVRVKTSPTDPAGAYNIVTDTGMRYPVPSEDVLRSLGYAPTDAVDMPAEQVRRIPVGPTLEPAAALRPSSPRP